MGEALPPRFEKLLRDNWRPVLYTVQTQRESILPGEFYVCFIIDTGDPMGRQLAELFDDDLATTLQEFHRTKPDPDARLAAIEIVEFKEAKRCFPWLPEWEPEPGSIAIAVVSGQCALAEFILQDILKAPSPEIDYG